jgi:hypothetical protein
MDTFWVCENHPAKPWDGPSACGCGGAGMPCPVCNVPSGDERPRPPAGFTTDIDVDDSSKITAMARASLAVRLLIAIGPDQRRDVGAAVRTPGRSRYVSACRH